MKFIKDTFDIQLTNESFSTLKSQIKKAGGTSKPAAKPGPQASKPAVSSTNGVPNVAHSIEAIKTLVDQLGVDQVKQIAEIFRK